MENLEFENFDVNEETVSSSQPDSVSPEEEQRENINFSNKVIKALEDKIKLNNTNSNFNIIQLKRVYTHGAKAAEEDRGLFAMARVNMYMRMKNEKQIILGKKKSAKKEKLTELVLEDSSVNRIDKYIDATANWHPSEKDFEEAKVDIVKYELDYEFKDIDDLYLDEYKRIEFEY